MDKISQLKIDFTIGIIELFKLIRKLNMNYYYLKFSSNLYIKKNKYQNPIIYLNKEYIEYNSLELLKLKLVSNKSFLNKINNKLYLLKLENEIDRLNNELEFKILDTI
jgi:hypothetical protein